MKALPNQNIIIYCLSISIATEELKNQKIILFQSEKNIISKGKSYGA